MIPDSEDLDLDAIAATRRAVFSAYRRGDVETMMAHFHPDVIQIPAFDKVLVGIDAVRANYEAALALFDIVLKDALENMEVAGDVATSHGTYTVTLTPKSGAAAIQRAGRYLVLMRRHAASPTGWATWRELVQPAS